MYPPFDGEYWRRIKSRITNHESRINNKYYLVVSRLEPYKKVDVVIKAFNELPDKKLVVAGIGSQEDELKRMANKNIQFISYVSDEELAQLYSNAEALIMPQEEDFGYVSLEAQFFGCPVIAYEKGGATESVLPNKTGLFFTPETPSSLMKVLEQFHTMSYNLKVRARKIGPENVGRFNKTIFVKNFLEAVSL